MLRDRIQNNYGTIVFYGRYFSEQSLFKILHLPEMMEGETYYYGKFLGKISSIQKQTEQCNKLSYNQIQQLLTYGQSCLIYTPIHFPLGVWDVLKTVN